MKNARKAVRKFKRIYKIKGVPTSYELIKIIKKIGFTTYGYTENEEKLIETKTYSLSKKKHAFSYVKGNQKYVFYDDILNEIDAERVLAHEIAHLYYNHLHRKDTIFDTDVNKEWEANLFAAYLLEPTNYKAILAKTTISLIAAILLFFCGKLCSEKVTLTQPNNQVYITPTGHHYHRENCQYGDEYINSFVVDRQTAKERYLPCDLCNPEK